MSIVMNGASFQGTHASQYWMPAYFEADTISSGCVSIWDGIKDKVNISSMTLTGSLQPRQAQPSTPLGTATVSEKILEPLSAMLYMTYNPSVLENQWESVQLSTFMLDRNLPNDFSSYVMYSVMSKIFGQDMEIGWWMSSTDYQALTDTTDARYAIQFCDGFMKRIVNDATVLDYASPAAITTSNILTFLDGLISLIALNKKALIGRKKRMKFVWSVQTANIWRQFLLSPTFKGIEYKQTGDNVYAGYEILTLNGVPDDTILFCECTKDQTGAFHIGMNSTGDENNIQVDRTRVMDETFFIKALMKFNTQIKFGNEIACMTTLTPASFTL